jgi:hypothetical protein
MGVGSRQTMVGLAGSLRSACHVMIGEGAAQHLAKICVTRCGLLRLKWPYQSGVPGQSDVAHCNGAIPDALRRDRRIDWPRGLEGHDISLVMEGSSC